MLDQAAPNDSKVSINGHTPLLPLELRGLSYEANGKRVIERVDLTIKESGITVIMGPNGAGKSVLLRLMHGLITPTAGEVRWGGKRLDRELARRQAMVFQKPVLLLGQSRHQAVIVRFKRGHLLAPHPPANSAPVQEHDRGRICGTGSSEG